MCTTGYGTTNTGVTMTATENPEGTAGTGSAGGTERRRTWQRQAIESFLSGDMAFRTAQEIHAQLRDGDSAVGLATVYRTLQAMASAGEVDTLRSDDGEISYRRCGEQGHHHHVVCRSCGFTVDVDDAPVRAWADEVAARHGFGQVEHLVEVFGVCADCQAKARHPSAHL